jgi:hypothetical protein
MFLLASSVEVCVHVHAGLGLCAVPVFPRSLCVVICAVAVSFIATCVLLASRVYVCVCAQVGCSVVCN